MHCMHLYVATPCTIGQVHLLIRWKRCPAKQTIYSFTLSVQYSTTLSLTIYDYKANQPPSFNAGRLSSSSFKSDRFGNPSKFALTTYFLATTDIANLNDSLYSDAVLYSE